MQKGEKMSEKTQPEENDIHVLLHRIVVATIRADESWLKELKTKVSKKKFAQLRTNPKTGIDLEDPKIVLGFVLALEEFIGFGERAIVPNSDIAFLLQFAPARQGIDLLHSHCIGVLKKDELIQKMQPICDLYGAYPEIVLESLEKQRLIRQENRGDKKHGRGIKVVCLTVQGNAAATRLQDFVSKDLNPDNQIL